MKMIKMINNSKAVTEFKDKHTKVEIETLEKRKEQNEAKEN